MILVAGANFGCGSSREHAVWGLLQAGIRAIVAPSFAEIFFANAMNNRLLLVTLPRREVDELMVDADHAPADTVEIDVGTLQLRSRRVQAGFSMQPRYRQMFLEGLDNIALTLADRARIDAFAAEHWRRKPWLRDVAAAVRDRDRGG